MDWQTRWDGHAKPESSLCASIAPAACSPFHQLLGSYNLPAFGWQRHDGLRSLGSGQGMVPREQEGPAEEKADGHA